MKKKRYFLGGGIDPLSMVSMAQQAATGIVDAFAPANEYGNQSPLAMAMKGNAQLGPIGAAMGYFQGKKLQKEDGWRRNYEGIERRRNLMNRSGAILSADPALVNGNRGAEYYASGGFLKNAYHKQMKASGGNLVPLSKNSAEVVGPSHSEGGVDLPEFNAELEGGESMQGDYVFSKRLGFAAQHKKLARAIGKIEQKPATPDRINALKSMKDQIQMLQQQQESIRQQNNLV